MKVPLRDLPISIVISSRWRCLCLIGDSFGGQFWHSFESSFESPTCWSSDLFRLAMSVSHSEAYKKGKGFKNFAF